MEDQQRIGEPKKIVRALGGNNNIDCDTPPSRGVPVDVRHVSDESESDEIASGSEDRHSIAVREMEFGLRGREISWLYLL